MAKPQQELEKYIDVSGSECLNGQNDHNLASIFKTEKEGQGFLLSDTDPQLLFTIHFNQAVKVQSFKLSAPANGKAPKKIKLFVNRLHMGFDDAESSPATQAFTLTPKDLAATGAALSVNVVKFQNVSDLTFFIEDNQGGDDNTQVDRLQLFGTLQHGGGEAAAAAAESGNVKHPASELEYNALKQGAGNKLVVVDFGAGWCGPCKFIAPVFADLSKRYSGQVVFVSVDVDKLKLADGRDVSGLPTFKFFRDNKLVHQFSGADAAQLEGSIRMYSAAQ